MTLFYSNIFLINKYSILRNLQLKYFMLYFNFRIRNKYEIAPTNQKASKIQRLELVFMTLLSMSVEKRTRVIPVQIQCIITWNFTHFLVIYRLLVPLFN